MWSSRQEECKRPSVEIQQEQCGWRCTGLMRGSPGKGAVIVGGLGVQLGEWILLSGVPMMRYFS